MYTDVEVTNNLEILVEKISISLVKKLDLSSSYSLISSQMLAQFKSLRSIIFHDLLDSMNQELMSVMITLEFLEEIKLAAVMDQTNDIVNKLSILPNLRSLSIMTFDFMGKIDNEGVKILPTFKFLEKLSLGSHSMITDEGMMWIMKMDNLRELSIVSCGIGDEGLNYLSRLKLLEKLDISYCAKVTDKGLNYLSNLKLLVSLDTSKCSVTDAGLINLTNLRKLNVRFCDKINGRGLIHFHQLDELDLTCTNVTNDELFLLAQLRSLRVLRLNNCENISDKGVISLGALNELYLKDCKLVTNESLNSLCRSNIQILDVGGCSIDDGCINIFASHFHLKRLILIGNMLTPKAEDMLIKLMGSRVTFDLW